MRYSNRLEVRARSISRRSGITMVEMLVVIGMSSFVLASASLSLVCLWRAQSDVQQDVAHAATVMRLSRQLRADAHLANAAILVPDGKAPDRSLGFTSADFQIEYSGHKQGILRVSSREEKVVHREIYVMNEFSVVSWEVIEEPDSIVRVSIATRDPRLADDDSPIRTQQIEAVVGMLAGESP